MKHCLVRIRSVTYSNKPSSWLLNPIVSFKSLVGSISSSSSSTGSSTSRSTTPLAYSISTGGGAILEDKLDFTSFESESSSSESSRGDHSSMCPTVMLANTSYSGNVLNETINQS